MSQWIKKELRGGKHYPVGDDFEGTIHDMNVEFKKNYGELSQKILNVPRSYAKDIAERHGVPLALGLASFQIEQDGILSTDVACELLKREYQRLIAIDHAVPSFESAHLEFAVKEGQWIEYIYKKFVREVNDRIGSVTTIEGLLNSNEIPVEKIFMVLNERNRLAGGLIAPVIHQWASTHRSATAFMGALAVTEALLKRPNKSEEARLAISKKIDEVRRMLDKLKSTLNAVNFTSWSEREMQSVEKIKNTVTKSLSEMNSPLESMSELSLAELIVQAFIKVSTPLPSIEKGSYLVVTSPFPESGELPPLLEDPYDFLERDIMLAKKRNDPKEFMRKTVEKVHKVLVRDNKLPVDVAINMILQMHNRFKETKEPNKEELSAKLQAFVHQQQKGETNVVEEIDFESIYAFLSNYFTENYVQPQSTKEEKTTTH